MVNLKKEPTERGGRNRMEDGWKEFWITLRYIAVILGVVTLVFILSKCDTNTPEKSPLDRCFDVCHQYGSTDNEIKCLPKCKELFGGINITKSTNTTG